MPMRLFLGLRLRILLVVSGVMIVVLGTITYLQSSRLQQEYLKGLLLRAEGMSEQMAAEIRSLAASTNNLDWVLNLQSINASQLYQREASRGVRHVGVINRDFTQVAHNDVSQRGVKVTDPALLNALRQARPSTVLLGHTYHTLIPVRDDSGLLAMLDIGMASHGIHSALGKQLQQTVLLSLLFMAIGIAGLYSLLNTLLLKPITALQQATRAIAEGQLNTELNQPGQHELGALTLDITRMRDAIRDQISTLETQQRTLEQRVTQRTLALERAKDQAEAANAAKAQFIANMSHELRTPLNALQGFLQLLDRTPLSEHQRDYLSKLHLATGSLLYLINDILDFSKLEAGKIILEQQPFQLEDWLRELSGLISGNLGNKPLELVFELDPDLPSALIGDAFRIKQVLINLVTNACKFTARGDVVIRVESALTASRIAGLRFSVSDTGIGIAQDKLNSIFEDFTQAEASTTRQFGGTGLGLGISQRLVQSMGGHLSVNSTLDQGSEFSFTIPLAVADPIRSLATLRAPLVKHLRILVLSAHQRTATAVMRLIGALDWQAEQAVSADQALARITQAAQDGEPFEVILLDEHLPGLAGLDLCASIQQHTVHLPILMMTSVTGREALLTRHDDIRHHVSGFLIKPLTAGMIVDAITDATLDNRLHLNAPLTRNLTPTLRLRGITLLLVEDNQTNQQVAKELLESEGARVIVADNGALGIAALDEHPDQIDAVLLDVQMPVMDGYAAARELRKRYEPSQLPIIAMTANAMTDDREACIRAGMDDFVGKPFDLDRLVSTVLRHWTPMPVLPDIDAPETPPALANFATAALLDAVDALRRMKGNRKAYCRALQRWLLHLNELQQRLTDEPPTAVDLGRLLHALKGSASTLGAHRLACLADARLTQQGAPAFHTLLNKAIQETTQAITLYLQTQHLQEATLPGEPDTANLAEQLQCLDTLLQARNMRALDVYDDIALQFLDTLTVLNPNAWRDLQDAMQQLNLAAGSLACRHILKELA